MNFVSFVFLRIHFFAHNAHSYRIASIGSFREALTAGATPKTIPTLMQTPIARPIAFAVISGRRGE